MLKNISAFGRVLNQIVKVLSKEQKKKALIVLTSMVLTSCLELVGVSAIYPFLQLIVDPQEIKNSELIGECYARFSWFSDIDALLFIGVIIIIVFILKNVAALWFAYIQNKFAADFQRDASAEMLDAYLKKEYQFFINTNSAVLLRGINDDVSSVYSILLNLFQLAGELLTVCMIGIFLVATDWFIAISSFLLVLICTTCIFLGIKGKMKKAGRQRRSAISKKNQYSYQAINGIKEITVMDRRDLFVSQYKKAADKASKAMLINAYYAVVPDRLLEAVCIGGIMGIICIRILLGIDLDSFVPVMGTFAMGAFKVIPSASKISTRVNNIIYNIPGLQSCYDNLISERMGQSTSSCRNDKGVEKRINGGLFNELSLNNVYWKYENSSNDILSGVNITIRRGESIALIGMSGAGKTTLADVCLGLLRPYNGSVELDGVSIFDIPKQWAKIIGYVPQTIFLIDDTIRANVAFGLPEEMVDDKKVWHALEMACLLEFVSALPDGIDTVVGERGVKFSGGQRQRIAIARALYENPDILVLDEATSALDTETEASVMMAIDALKRNKTLIIVAHRISTIKNCDRIIKIVNGKAVEVIKEEVIE